MNVWESSRKRQRESVENYRKTVKTIRFTHLTMRTKITICSSQSKGDDCPAIGTFTATPNYVLLLTTSKLCGRNHHYEISTKIMPDESTYTSIKMVRWFQDNGIGLKKEKSTVFLRSSVKVPNVTSRCGISPHRFYHVSGNGLLKSQ